MDTQELLRQLDVIKSNPNKEWLAGLEDRKLDEIDLHNKLRDEKVVTSSDKTTQDSLYGNVKFYRAAHLYIQFIEAWIQEHSRNKVFLDYACGNGGKTIRGAKAGAELAIGIDISDVSVQNAARIANEEGVSANTYFLQADCENTRLPSNSIDVIFAGGMLHHLDLSFAFHELRRILKPGGVVLAAEALAYNPLIQLYRNLTPAMRTKWEKDHILSYKEVAFAKRFFQVRNVRHWHLFSLFGVYVPAAMPLLDAIDRLVLRVPGLRLMSWMFTFEMYKANNAEQLLTRVPTLV